jgi:hypothetical protein
LLRFVAKTAIVAICANAYRIEAVDWAQMKDDYKKRAAQFVSDLAGVAGPKNFYRVFLRHWNFFEALLENDESWENIADLLTEAGARHRRGQKISGAQLREYNSRRKRKAAQSGSHATYTKTLEDSAIAGEHVKHRSASLPDTATQPGDAQFEKRRVITRPIEKSRVSQRMEMMTKTRRGKKYDFEE